MQMAHKRTLENGNQFSFVCPIFNSETKISQCIELREQVWFGNRPDTRKGCQACMRASKCPINFILTDMVRTGADPYFSPVPKLGKLEDHVLKHIRHISIPDHWIRNYPLTPTEVRFIAQANDNARDFGAEKKARATARLDLDEVKAKSEMTARPTSSPEPAQDDVVAAAMSGDLGAALNAAKAPEPVSVPMSPVQEPKPIEGAKPRGFRGLKLFNRG